MFKQLFKEQLFNYQIDRISYAVRSNTAASSNVVLNIYRNFEQTTVASVKFVRSFCNSLSSTFCSIAFGAILFISCVTLVVVIYNKVCCYKQLLESFVVSSTYTYQIMSLVLTSKQLITENIYSANF